MKWNNSPNRKTLNFKHIFSFPFFSHWLWTNKHKIFTVKSEIFQFFTLCFFSHQFVTWSSRARNLLSSRTIHLAQPQQKPNDDEAFFPFEKTNKQTEQNHLRNVCNTCNLREKHSQWGEISFQFPNANESSMSENHNAQHIFHKRFDSFFSPFVCVI